MSHTTINAQLGTVVYIVPFISDRTNAISTNILLRKNLIERLGYSVLLVNTDRYSILSSFKKLWILNQKIVCVIIRMDGSCKTDAYTLLKFAFHATPFIWELHGFAEESYAFSESFLTSFRVALYNLRRALLSYLVSSCQFISGELLDFAEKKIFIRHAQIIHNFTSPKRTEKTSSLELMLQSLKRNKYKILLWGGSAELPWQAIDIIERTALSMQKRHKKILFVLIGARYWTPMSAHGNILYVHPVSHPEFLRSITYADICLAIYHKPKHHPFYFFPMKILDYMATGKPVIATGFGTIKKLIRHGENGMLTNNSVTDLRRNILRLLRKPAIMQIISHRAKHSVWNSNSTTIASRQYEDLFMSVGLPTKNRDINITSY